MIGDAREPVVPVPGLAVMSTRPDRNCFLCGSRDWCGHNPDPSPLPIIEHGNVNAQARLDGIVARRHGKPKSANPHGGGNRSQRSAWSEGWHAADQGPVN